MTWYTEKTGPPRDVEHKTISLQRYLLLNSTFELWANTRIIIILQIVICFHQFLNFPMVIMTTLISWQNDMPLPLPLQGTKQPYADSGMSYLCTKYS
jgi:hypothetical protein